MGARVMQGIFTLAAATLIALLVHRAFPGPGDQERLVTLDLIAPQRGDFYLFVDNGTGFGPERAEHVAVLGSPAEQRILFRLPKGAVNGLRFDPGDTTCDVTLRSFGLEGPGGSIQWKGSAIAERFTQLHSIRTERTKEDGLVLHLDGPDPWIASSVDLSSAVAAISDVPVPLLRWSCALLAGILGFIALRALLARAGPWAASSASGRYRTLGSLLLIDLVLSIAALGVLRRVRDRAEGVSIRFEVIAPDNDLFQFFYSNRAGEFSPGRCVPLTVKGSPSPQWIAFALPPDSLPSAIRFDPGSRNASVTIRSVAFTHGDAVAPVSLTDLLGAINGRNDIASTEITEDGLVVRASGRDPFLSFADVFGERMRGVLNEDEPWVLPLLGALLLTVLVHAGLARSPGFNRAVGAASVRDLALAGSFIALLFIPLLVTLHPALLPRLRFTEKRKLAEMPSLELKNLGTYPSAYESWYRDHFGLRQELFRANSWLHVAVLHTSPLPDRVIMGKDGWFFQSNEFVVDDYRGRTLYTFDELERIRRIYERRQAWLATMGIRYYIVIPPLSGNLNREHMPDRFHRTSDTTWLGLIKSHFDKYSTVPVIDVRDDLLNAKKIRDVYFRTDIHWNPFGAYFGYRRVIGRMAVDIPSLGPPVPLEDIRFRIDTNDQGDIAQMLGLNDVLTRVEPVIVPLEPRKAVFSHFPELPGQYYFLDRPQTFVQADTTLPKLLMFHDSFGLYLKPLLSEHFSRSTYVWSGLFIPDVVLVEKPDVVVQEFMEMFAVNMPKDTLALTY